MSQAAKSTWKKEMYTCPRCGYKRDDKSAMSKHFNNLKKKCPALVNDIELTDDIKQYILDNRVFRTAVASNNNLNKENTRLQHAIDILHVKIETLRNKKPEKFYQHILSHYFEAGHKKLKGVGITDVTTDTMHVEIKNWNNWTISIGQILLYNQADKKEKLQIFLFGTPPICKTKKEMIIATMVSAGIQPFHVSSEDDNYYIEDLSSNEIIHQAQIPEMAQLESR